MKDEREIALRIQNELKDLADQIAQEMAAGADQRDTQKIADLWNEMKSRRPRLNSAHRAIRKAENVLRGATSRKEYELAKSHQKEARALSKRLRMWDEMDLLVARHISPLPSKLDLYPYRNSSDDMLAVMSRAFYELANPNPQSEDSMEFGAFADIPLPFVEFNNLMRVCYRLLLAQGRAANARFLDVGCGGGAKVMAASTFFSECHGLEYDPLYVAAAQKAFETVGSDRCRAFEGNGLTFDGYGDYDVIYFYRPMREDEMLQKMERQVFENAKPGALIVPVYNIYLDPRDGLEGAKVLGPIFLAGATQSEADTLRENAKFTATTLVERAKDRRFDPGFWTPLMDAASYDGAM